MNNFYILYRFFYKKLPFYTVFAAVILLMSQFMLLVSYFLPIKIILLLSSPTVPHIVSSLFPHVGREEIIMILTLCVFVVYGLHLGSEKYAANLIDQISCHLLGMPETARLNHTSFEFKFVDSYIKSLSTLSLMTVLYLLIIFLYQFIAIAMLAYIVIIFFILKIIKVGSHHLNSFFKLVSGLGFILVFVLEILDTLYLKSQEFSILNVLVILIVSRYIFMRSLYLANKLTFLHSNTESFYLKVKA